MRLRLVDRVGLFQSIKVMRCSCGFVGAVDHYKSVTEYERFEITTVGTSGDWVKCPKCGQVDYVVAD